VPREKLKNRRFVIQNRYEITPYYGMSMNDHFTTHHLFSVSGCYHFPWGIAVGITAGYAMGDWTYFFYEAKERASIDVAKQSAITNLTVLDWIASADFYWNALYGKLNMGSELMVNVELFLTAGFGAAGTRYKGFKGAEDKKYSTKVLPNFGGLMRFYVNRMFNIHLGIKDYTFKEEVNFQSNGQTKTTSSWVHIPLFMVGLGVVL
jgi:outer membrane beta-barrel protein